MSKRQIDSNVDLVNDLMAFSPFGALGQIFVVEAIRRYAEITIESPPWKERNPLINEASWRGVAKDVKERCDAFYSRNRAEDDGIPYEEDPDEQGA